jgi:hypothetical protein
MQKGVAKAGGRLRAMPTLLNDANGWSWPQRKDHSRVVYLHGFQRELENFSIFSRVMSPVFTIR